MILDQGARQMVEEGKDVFYYVTVMNQNYGHPNVPQAAREAVIKGMYGFACHRVEKARGSVHLLGSGSILREVITAAELLATDWQVASDVWSVTSFSELARDARDAARYNRPHPEEPPRVSHIDSCLYGPNPIIAATDYVAAYPQLISCHVSSPFVVLGTDGFGRSDTRSALRRFFEVDRHNIVVAALHALAKGDFIPAVMVSEAISRYGIDSEEVPPWMR